MNPVFNLLLSIPAEEKMRHLEGGVALSETAAESSYFIARILMDCSKWVLNLVGLEHNATAIIWVYSILVFAVAFVIGKAVQFLLVAALRKIGPHINNDLYMNLRRTHFFSKVCRIVPALFFLILIQFTLNAHESLSRWLTSLSWIYIVIILAISITTLADVIWAHVNARENKKKLPLSGLVQLIKLIVWIISVIIIAAILFDKSPASLLAGLGAFAAVLMLVFKDSILGVVAGVQLSENDSLHVGDWIAVPNSDVNGTVTEVSLTAVKVENWDKTISTVPPYGLITNGFKNYRNMQESNTRRIQRSYMIDADSVVETDDAMLEQFKSIPLMKEWIEKKIAQRDAGKVEDVNNSEGLVNGSIATNLGVFRAYLQLYLNNSSLISHTSDCFITTLPQTAYGIPLQLYCFTSTSSWIPYEGIMATIFEHIAVMLYRFRLYTFESESGRDTLLEGYLSAGRPTTPLFGMPYPTYMTAKGQPMAEQPKAYWPPVMTAPDNIMHPDPAAADNPSGNSATQFTSSQTTTGAQSGQNS